MFLTEKTKNDFARIETIFKIDMSTYGKIIRNFYGSMKPRRLILVD